MRYNVEDFGVQRRLSAHEVNGRVLVVIPKLVECAGRFIDGNPYLVSLGEVFVVAELAPDVTSKSQPQYAPSG
jgi:hypothetical protein